MRKTNALLILNGDSDFLKKTVEKIVPKKRLTLRISSEESLNGLIKKILQEEPEHEIIISALQDSNECFRCLDNLSIEEIYGKSKIYYIDVKKDPMLLLLQMRKKLVESYTNLTLEFKINCAKSGEIYTRENPIGIYTEVPHYIYHDELFPNSCECEFIVEELLYYSLYGDEPKNKYGCFIISQNIINRLDRFKEKLKKL